MDRQLPPQQPDDQDDLTKPAPDLNFRDDQGLQLDTSPQNEDGVLSKILGAVRDRFSKNLKTGSDAIGDATNEMTDKLQMATHPELQGPRQDWNQSPAGDRLTQMEIQNLPMMGTLTPRWPNIVGMIGRSAAPEVEQAAAQAMKASVAPSAKLAAAKLAAEEAMKGTATRAASADAVARAQGGLSRAVDQSQRYSQQMQAMKQAVLDKLRGR